MLVDTSLLVWLQRFIVVFFIFIPAIAHATDEVKQAPDHAITQIRLTPRGSSTPIVFSVRLAVTPSQHAYGLMFSPPLPAKSGMLFLFEDMKPRTFWMKNTPLPLSIAFIDASGRIVHMADMAPLKEEPVPSIHPAMYALEMTQGWFSAHGVMVGQTIAGLPKASAR